MLRLILSIMCLFSIVSAYPQDTDIKRAEQLINNGKYLEAAKLLRPLAEKGNPQAQYLAAGLFVEGKGVMKSLPQAEKYYLLAANNGHDDAAIKLCDIYNKIQQPEKASQLLVDLCEKDKEKEKTLLGFHLGHYYFTGHGHLTENKLLGWGMMYRSRHNFEDEGSSIFENLKKEFYPYLLKTEDPDPNALCQYMGDYYWNYMSKPEWAANYLDDAVLLIKSLPYESQVEHLNTWEKVRLNASHKDAAAVVLGMMYAEGIGTEQNLPKAKGYYSIISNDTYSLLYENLYKHMETGSNGHLNMSLFPNFAKIVVIDYEERKARMTFETKKANIVAKSTVPQTNVEFMNATWNNGTLRVSFIITNKAMNPSKLTTSEGGRSSCKELNGTYKHGKADIWGFTNTLAKGKEGYVSIEFKNMPSSGELEFVRTSLQCQYGQGDISANNVVWDVNYQRQ